MAIDSGPAKLVCLTGFMGSGKSTAGRLLARQLGWPHVDLDTCIEEAARTEIPQIFASQGEPEFRRIEHQELLRVIGEALESRRSRVISLGGGTIAQPHNLAALRENRSVLIWLECPLETLLARCAQITNRPLFRDEASFRELYRQRLPFYQLSDYRVDSGAEPVSVIEQILALGIFPKVIA
ncbi:MAG TPA: shikimate kinase [Candidatus Acidoferrum sp.]|nr:shikimate kinase [Candidatus Acidoferrum sp.]